MMGLYIHFSSPSRDWLRVSDGGSAELLLEALGEICFTCIIIISFAQQNQKASGLKLFFEF